MTGLLKGPYLNRLRRRRGRCHSTNQSHARVGEGKLRTRNNILPDMKYSEISDQLCANVGSASSTLTQHWRRVDEDVRLAHLIRRRATSETPHKLISNHD